VAICTFKRAQSVKQFMDSLAQHDSHPDLLLIVDASPDDSTEKMVESYAGVAALARRVLYFRVTGIYKTLTCSRNFALRWVSTDLMVFFDDDIELLPHCLAEMEKPHRMLGDVVMGVGAYIQNEPKTPNLLWRVRRFFGIVPHLRPGHYPRSGVSIPWNFLAPTEELVEGDWLRGCAMMWKTATAREIGFNESFGGHSNGEDLDFSLRAATRGKLLVNGKAHVLHLPDSSGRPDGYMMAYMTLRNAYGIHRSCLRDRRWRDAAWFMYAYSADSALRAIRVLVPGNTYNNWRFLLGRLRFFRELALGKL
jgi:GT2 family glycosyltransferase